MIKSLIVSLLSSYWMNLTFLSVRQISFRLWQNLLRLLFQSLLKKPSN